MRQSSRVVLAMIMTCAAALCQTSQINGVVRDSSGSVVPGAAVKETQTATGVVRTANSGTDGGYVIPNLPIGPYLLEVTKDGFNKYLQNGIVLQVNTST